MPTKKSPVSSPTSQSSESEKSLFSDRESEREEDEGDIPEEGEEGDNILSSSEDEEEVSQVITPKSRTVVSSDSEIITPKRRTKKLSPSSSEVVTPKSKKVVTSDSEEVKTPKTKGKKKIIIASSSESDSEDKKHIPILKITKDSNEKESMYQSRVIITDIINKTVIEGEDGSLNRTGPEAAILLGRQINDKFWLGLTYDDVLEALIEKYIKTSPELDAFYPTKEIQTVPAVTIKLPTEAEKDQMSSENSAEVLAEAQHNYNQATQEGE
jgi:hypothetical protein